MLNGITGTRILLFVKSRWSTNFLYKNDPLQSIVCGYYYQCLKRNKKKKRKVSLLYHHKSMHNINYSRKSIKHLGLEPDILDPVAEYKLKN